MQNSTDILAQGANLMLYGMGGVFIFLTVLVGVTMLLSQVTERFFKEKAASVDSQSLSTTAKTTTSAIDPQKLRILQAAVDAHRASATR